MQTWLVMMWSLVRAVRTGSQLAPLALLVGVCAGNVCVARGDIQPAEPFYVTVARPDAELRCREGDISYIVATLKPGTVLRADGKGDGWIRVHYPDGLQAVVKANEVSYDAAKNQVTLATPSRLRAMELAGGARSHWWHLLEKDLPAGQSFRVLEVLKHTDGAVVAYKIPAPAGARGFLRQDAVRDATPAEVASLEPAGATTRAANPTPATEAQPADAQPATAQAPADPSQQTSPTAEDPTTELSPATTVVVNPPAPTGPEDALMARVDTLARVFNDVQKQPLREAEIDPAIAEFEAAVASLGESDTEQALQGFLTTRLELLKIRRDIRAQLAAIDSSGEALDQQAKRVEDLVSELTNAGRYVVVGRLTPSTVYDGRRLPLMYRIESVGSGLARTIAYLQPKAGEDFAPMLGRMVGVVGQIETDSERNIKIVRHTAVDLIKNPAAQAPTPSAAAEPATETASADQGSD